MKIINPANGTKIRELEEDNEASVKQKYERAKLGQLSWAKTSLEERKNCIIKFKQAMIDRKEDLARILTEEVGKPISQARNELGGLIGRIDFFLDNFSQTLADELVHSEAKLSERISHEPLGVIANISAWNYPYFVGANVFVPALLAGNAVLYKPSEFATLTGLAITDALIASGVPKDVFIPVIGSGTVGALLLEQPIQGVFFTGSFAIGQKIAQAAGKKMIRVQLELGGKDPTYVSHDADPKAAAESLADGAFYNTGQSCCSVERIYVHEKIYDAFVEHFLSTARNFVIGEPMDEKTYIGPLTREPQLAVLEQQIKDAVVKGAKLVLGGNKINRPGYYFEPTVFIDVNHSMELMREESFGPLIGIQKVKSDAEAIELMNDTKYGLTAGVYTKDQANAEKLMAKLNAGSVYWNCCDRVSPKLPWSGRGHSGMGVTLSTYGIQCFTQPKAWHLRTV